ncbi:MAG: hypothetical protein PVG14_13770 [Anaerolineales bacterium]
MGVISGFNLGSPGLLGHRVNPRLDGTASRLKGTPEAEAVDLDVPEKTVAFNV